MNTQNEVDELTSYNEGLVDGHAIGMKSPWIKFVFHDGQTWPEKEGQYVTVDSRGMSRTLYFSIQGDADCEWQISTTGMTAKNPQYWCPLPDPMDHE